MIIPLNRDLTMLSQKNYDFITLIQYFIDTVLLIEDLINTDIGMDNKTKLSYGVIINQHYRHIRNISELNYLKDIIIDRSVVFELINLFDYNICIDDFLKDYTIDSVHILTLLQDLKCYHK